MPPQSVARGGQIRPLSPVRKVAVPVGVALAAATVVIGSAAASELAIRHFAPAPAESVAKARTGQSAVEVAEQISGDVEIANAKLGERVATPTPPPMVAGDVASPSIPTVGEIEEPFDPELESEPGVVHGPPATRDTTQTLPTEVIHSTPAIVPHMRPPMLAGRMPVARPLPKPRLRRPTATTTTCTPGDPLCGSF